MINRLIKNFEFREEDRAELVFSDSRIRVDAAKSKVQQPQVELTQSNNIYSTDPWLSVRTGKTNPKGVQKWLLFDPIEEKPTDTDILYRPGTTVGLADEEYYWNGSVWDIADDLEFAEATLTVVDYTQLAGASYSIGGLIRSEGNQWEAAVSNNETAESIAADINTFSNVRAEVVGSVITVIAIDSGTGGNSITLATSDVVNLEPSSATLLGGLDAQYNTVDEVNAGIESLLDFIVNDRSGDKTIYWRANLKTIDPTATPLLKEIKLLGQFEVEWLEDIVYNTIRSDMHAKVRYPFDLEVTVAAATSSIDLSDDEYSPDNEGYNIVGVESVYNMTADPHRLNNLFSSYAPGTLNQDGETNAPGVITLSSSVSEDDVLWIKLLVVPEIVVNTDQDFYELRKFPTIVFERIDGITGSTVAKYTQLNGSDFVRDLANGTAVEVQPPAVQDLSIGFSVFTSGQVDLQRLMIAIQEYFDQNVVVRTNALDEKVTMVLTEELREAQSPDLNAKNTASGAFVLKSVPFYLKKSLDRFLVQNVNLETSQH